MSAHTLARRLWAGELGAAGAVLAALLLPGEAAYRLGTALRNRAYDRGGLNVQRATVPVISVGNVAVGGTGKTPFANWLGRRLAARGRRPAVLHGGYADDEPALHRAWSPDIPVVVERDRVRGAEVAARAGADVIVLDDAFQHRRLHRDLDIVLVAAERWAGSRRLLPRGPWREPVSALERADVVVVTRKAASAPAAAAVAADVRGRAGRPAAIVHLRPAGWRRVSEGEHAPRTTDVVLVSGIAEPGTFADNARATGARVVDELIFPDHHDYTEDDVARIRHIAAGRPVLTTAKDWVRLHGRVAGVEVRVLDQELVVEEGAALLDELIDRVLS